MRDRVLASEEMMSLAAVAGNRREFNKRYNESSWGVGGSGLKKGYYKGEEGGEYVPSVYERMEEQRRRNAAAAMARRGRHLGGDTEEGIPGAAG